MEIAREARVLLARERERGRRRIAVVRGWNDPVRSDNRPAAQNAADLNSLSGSVPPPDQQRPETIEVLTLPGFESVVPTHAAASPPPRRITLREDVPADLPSLERAVSACRLCRLCETRTQTVFADGSATARLLLVGEAPGRDEDAQGVPFVGRAGQLLNKMLAAIDLKRDEVYICNVLKCRPPENRTPQPDEVERCLPYLEQQVALVRPELICALGLSAAQALIETKASMASMRGRTFEYRGIPLIPTYHPAALLRNPGLKREAWADLQRVRDLLRAGSAA